MFVISNQDAFASYKPTRVSDLFLFLGLHVNTYQAYTRHILYVSIYTVYVFILFLATGLCPRSQTLVEESILLYLEKTRKNYVSEERERSTRVGRSPCLVGSRLSAHCPVDPEDDLG